MTFIRPVDPSPCANSSPQMTRTVIRRLHHQGMRARRPIKRPQLTLRHRHARFDWSHDHLGWTIRTWRRVHWSDESVFLLQPVLSQRRIARSTCTWTVSNILRLTKTLHQSYNDGMVIPEVVCHPSMAKTTVMHANSLPPFWYG
jgi:hypothetical protein